ncbi:hypothetical protein [Dietzia maris]|uniref:Uncharacterized protein n=1 Tax=Dietzia maris TaxID=37915 RepID=A0ABT8H4U9_9ACTN|nr:hypothetical protein [Dietzia maris]MDN4507486.1 hypothetical protein [Dietzia maris]
MTFEVSGEVNKPGVSAAKNTINTNRAEKGNVENLLASLAANRSEERRATGNGSTGSHDKSGVAFIEPSETTKYAEIPRRYEVSIRLRSPDGAVESSANKLLPGVIFTPTR